MTRSRKRSKRVYFAPRLLPSQEQLLLGAWSHSPNGCRSPRGKYGEVPDNQNHLPSTTGDGKNTYFVQARVVPEVTSRLTKAGLRQMTTTPRMLRVNHHGAYHPETIRRWRGNIRLSFERFYWLRLTYSMDFLPFSQTRCADSNVPRSSSSALGMGSPVPTATRPNTRQRQLAELRGARLCCCTLGSSPGTSAWPRALPALQWSDPGPEQGPSDLGCGIRCLLER